MSYGIKDLDALRAAHPDVNPADLDGKLVTLDAEGYPVSAAEKFLLRSFAVPIPADLNAGTATAETLFGQIPFDATVVSVSVLTSETLAADAVNYATVNVYTRTAAGGSQTKLGSVNTVLGWADALGTVAGAFAGDGPPTSVDVSANALLTYDVEKTLLGAKLPACVLVVHYKPR